MSQSTNLNGNPLEQFDYQSALWVLSSVCIFTPIITSYDHSLPLFMIGVALYTMPDFIDLIQQDLDQSRFARIFDVRNLITASIIACVSMASVGILVSSQALTDISMYLMIPVIVMDVLHDILVKGF
jgi:hypothetical protein